MKVKGGDLLSTFPHNLWLRGWGRAEAKERVPLPASQVATTPGLAWGQPGASLGPIPIRDSAPGNSCSSSYGLRHFTSLGLSFPICEGVVVLPRVVPPSVKWEAQGSGMAGPKTMGDTDLWWGGCIGTRPGLAVHRGWDWQEAWEGISRSPSCPVPWKSRTGLHSPKGPEQPRGTAGSCTALAGQ